MDRADSLPCQHPNVLGCPNHGELARMICKSMRDGGSLTAEVMRQVAPDDAWPVVQVIDLGLVDLVLWDWKTLDALS